MPANTLDSYFMQDTRNNFDAIRPLPVCSDANQIVGQCHRKIHISNNCYYGYQLPQVTANKHEIEDCEMMDIPAETSSTPPPMKQGYNARKRGAELLDYAQCKRLKEEVQREMNIEPETTEKMKNFKSPEEFVEDLYWHTHDVSSICNRVGTRSSPSHAASALNIPNKISINLCIRIKFSATIYCVY